MVPVVVGFVWQLDGIDAVLAGAGQLETPGIATGFPPFEAVFPVYWSGGVRRTNTILSGFATDRGGAGGSCPGGGA